MTDRARLEGALGELRALGFFAKGGQWVCCQSCGLGDIEKEYGPEKPYVFWHDQTDEAAFGPAIYDWPENEDEEPSLVQLPSKLIAPIWLSWQGDMEAIMVAFQRAGFVVVHDGSPDTCVKVTTWDLLAAEDAEFDAELRAL